MSDFKIPPRPWAVVSDPVRTSLHWIADANGEAVMRGDLLQGLAVERFIVGAVNSSAVARVHLDGGLIHNITFEGAPCTVIVRDYDIEGSDRETETDADGEHIVTTWDSGIEPEIDTSDIPEVGPEFWANAKLTIPPTFVLTAFAALLPEIDSEIDSRRFSGNAEDWRGLLKLYSTAKMALDFATAAPTVPAAGVDYAAVGRALWAKLCDNWSAWEGEEDSVKEEHESLMAETDAMIEGFRPLFAIQALADSDSRDPIMSGIDEYIADLEALDAGELAVSAPVYVLTAEHGVAPGRAMQIYASLADANDEASRIVNEFLTYCRETYNLSGKKWLSDATPENWKDHDTLIELESGAAGCLPDDWQTAYVEVVAEYVTVDSLAIPSAADLKASRVADAGADILAALLRLRNCPDVNLDSLENETIAALEQADEALAKAGGE